jgi:hypothetical protein
MGENQGILFKFSLVLWLLLVLCVRVCVCAKHPNRFANCCGARPVCTLVFTQSLAFGTRHFKAADCDSEREGKP